MVRPWTAEDDQVLRTLYPTERREIIISTLKRSWCAIKHRASKLGIRRVEFENPGHTGHSHSPEARALMSAKTRGEKHPYFGKHRPEQTRAKIRNALLGRHLNEKHREKLSISHMGLRQPPEVVAKRRESIVRAYIEGRKRVPPHIGVGNGGYRQDLPHPVRSRWEANFARLLIFKGIPYRYEPNTFEVTLQDGMKVSYTPDFKIRNTYVELKGWETKEAKAKIEAFRAQYPHLRLVCMRTEHYRRIERKYASLIPGWEHEPMRERREVS